ncbi:MAG TPA: protein translocase subunit SecD [Miltoncostaeaceae bacterium]|nr:protein translocase subunit SecD [Miltoncostaeaceae bacterium]
MTLRRRSLLFLLVVLGLVGASIAVIAIKPTVLGLDLQGGSQVILQGRPLGEAQVDSDSIRRSVNVINNRVNKFGVSEPEIQTQGKDQISVSLPGVTDPNTLRDLIKPTQLFFYNYYDNLVGYTSFQGQQTFPNPTTDLFSLVKRSQITTPKDGFQKTGPKVYLFRTDGHQFVTGPGSTRADVISTLANSTKASDRAIATLYRTNRSAFNRQYDFQKVPEGFVIVTDGTGTDRANPPLCGQGGPCVLLYDRPGLIGSDISSARRNFDNLTNKPVVELDFSGGGGRKFGQITRDLVRESQAEGRPADQSRSFAVVLDGVIITNPIVNFQDNPGGIQGGRAQIEGNFTDSSASTLADQISSGAFPIKLEVISQQTVSATLGKQSLRQGLVAGLIGLGLVMIFLIAYYRFLGMIAALALVTYGLLFWAVAKLIPITLTLPGIAGLILTIGVAADANVVIFERVREEARAGRPGRVAVLNGYRRGITAIIDANVVTLITAVILFLFSTAGPKGFALTLIIGVLLSLFTAVLATQAALGILVDTKIFQNERVMGLHQREIRWKFDFVGRWKLWLLISFVPMIAGVFVIGIGGLKPGLDFKSGTKITAVFQQAQPNDGQVRSTLASAGFGDAKVQTFTRTRNGQPERGVEIQTETLNQTQQNRLIGSLQSRFNQPDRSFIEQIQSVGPTFGREIVRRAIYVILFSFLAIILYLAIRFEYKLALPALLSVIHDVWLALTIYAILGLEVTSSTVAALLTILGYSLYDVVIVFDRIRENQRLLQGQPYRQIVNRSVHETLTRSIITSILTLLPIIVLLIFGGPTLRDFAFALFIGILSGGVSSIFISAPLAALWKEREPQERRREARRQKRAAAPVTDSDIVDVEALARAEAQLDAQMGGVRALDAPPDEAPVPEREPEPAPNGAPVDRGHEEPEEPPAADEPVPVPDAPEGVAEAGDGQAPEADGGTDGGREPDQQPERVRRHRQVQRKRRPR